MERLVYELEQLSVSTIWIETRDAALNRRDQRMLDALRQQGTLSPGTVVAFARPYDEPMLWVADAVAGAVSGKRKGGDPEPREALGASVTEIDVVLT